MIRGIIFDLDGVICFTDHFHYLAWKCLADEEGIPFNVEINDRLRGVSRMESLEIILEQAPRSYSPEEKCRLAERKNEKYQALLREMSPKDLPDDVRGVLSELKAAGYRLAIGSSSKNAPLILERIGLSTFFDAVSDGNNITRSKPDPEVFWKAAELLSLPNADCLVVEDAEAGILAARRAGMCAVAVGAAAQAETGDHNLSVLSELIVLLRRQ